MVNIKSFISSLVLFQGVQSYCIYNNLEDDTSFDVSQGFSKTSEAKTFKKYMRPNTKECCPYTTSDCSYRTVSDDEATFYFYFHWPTISTDRYTIKCTTGGGLNIVGTHQNHSAFCVDAQGVETQVAIIPSTSRFWKK